MTKGFTATAYAYPWDVVGDPQAVDRWAALGVESVTLAAAYHAVRAATPRHPGHRLVEAAAALYMPVRAEAWRGHRLVPRSAEPWAGAHSFSRARDALAAGGLATQAWVVATHGDGMGDVFPELCVQNAYGDSYSYALCPSSREVRRYAATLVSEVATITGVDSMVVEACGPLGVAHQSQHEKTAGADWTETDERLLSICFCTACCAGYGERGVHPEAIAHRVRTVVGSGAVDIESALEGLGSAVQAVRREGMFALRDDVVQGAQSNGVARLSFHATLDPWATGPAAALVDDSLAVDAYVAHCWSHARESVERVSDLAAGLMGRAVVGAYCTILPPVAPRADELLAHWESLVSAGARELHLYHAGMASAARLDAAAEALAALRDSDRI
jgi:hypothetical protein